MIVGFTPDLLFPVAVLCISPSPYPLPRGDEGILPPWRGKMGNAQKRGRVVLPFAVAVVGRVKHDNPLIFLFNVGFTPDLLFPRPPHKNTAGQALAGEGRVRGALLPFTVIHLGSSPTLRAAIIGDLPRTVVVVYVGQALPDNRKNTSFHKRRSSKIPDRDTRE